MAEIQVERRKKGTGASWLVGLIVLVALLGAGWYFTMGPGSGALADDADLDVVAPSTPASGTATAPAPGAP